jgi:hypothetical protein
MRLRGVFAAALVVGLGLALSTQAAVPPGWTKAGSAPADYVFDVDATTAVNGKQSASITAKPGATSGGFGTLMQIIAADNYRGGRWRLSGYLRTETANRAQMWMRVDGANAKALSFDNMDSHPVTGTTGWTRYEIVLDVPPESVDIAFGFLLQSSGKVWGDGFRLEKVDATVPVTFAGPPLPRDPVNLDFEASDATQTAVATLEYAQGPGPYVFDCDAPWGQTKTLNIRAPGDKLQITGSIRFLYTGGKPSEWFPTAAITLVQQDQRSSVRLEALVAGNITYLALWHGGPWNTGFGEIESTGASMPFAVTLDQTGKVHSSVWGISSRVVQTASGIDHVMLSCSTTHARFTDITIVASK